MSDLSNKSVLLNKIVKEISYVFFEFESLNSIT